MMARSRTASCTHLTEDSSVATVEQCEEAMHRLAERLAQNDPSRQNQGFDRTMSCTLSDLDVTFTGRLKDGQLLDIRQASKRDAQVRLTMSSDDLIALVDGKLKMASAWATKRVKVEAGVRDLMKLRSIF
jgi:alkyl sulfatase BDS1-like metallo-beta-lactamase superfamily hydrolase